MYSKKINQLATNLNPQSTDLLPIGDAETGQLKTTTFNQISGVSSDGVISGGIVTWTGTGLNFTISACTYYLNGIRYSSPFTTKTLAAADPTNARIDVFAVNTSSQVVVIQGTPAVNPIEPEGDLATTLGLTNVTINAGATTPSGVTRDLIYDENVETWTKAIVGGSGFSYNLADTTQFYTGVKSIKVIQGNGYAQFRFSQAVATDIRDYKSLSFAIRLNAAWGNQIFQISFWNGLNRIANYAISTNNVVGFNRLLANQWQQITISLSLLTFKSNAFTGVQIYTSGLTTTYFLDTIQLNGGINNPPGTTSTNNFGFAKSDSGTATADQATDTLNVVGTGLITTSATGKTLTIASNQIATSSILGRVTASTGNIETLTGTQATTLLDVFTSTLKGLAPASGGGTTNFLRADGTWAAAGGSMAIGGSITSATAGSVLFAGTSGVLQQDNANFFWDDTNNRLGIGTTTPQNQLHIENSTAGISQQIYLKNNSTTGNSRVTLINNSGTGGSIGTYGSASSQLNWRNNLVIGSTQDLLYFVAGDVISGDTTYKHQWHTGGYGSSTAKMTLTAAGRLLLGTTTEGTFLLDVNGTAKASQLTLTGSSGVSLFIASGTAIRGSTSGQITYIDGAPDLTGTISIRSTSVGISGSFSCGAASTGSLTVGLTCEITSTGVPSLRLNKSANIWYIEHSRNVTNALTISQAASPGNIPAVSINSNGNVSLNITTGNASALLDITSTTKGFLPPRMTTTQKNAIGTPAQGLMVFDTTLVKLCVYSGTAWETITSI
jgi:hypothetical protein